MEISLASDEDGFISHECPSCDRRFKLSLEDEGEHSLSCCPYCGHRGEDCWFTTEQAEYIQGLAMERLVAPSLRQLAKDLGSSSSDFLQINTKLDLPEPPVEPIDTDGNFNVLHFPCCNQTAKLEPQDQYFCVACGSEISMTTTSAKKVFLSHKGCDKAMVIEFKETLQALGYEPWLDKQDMPVGTNLERGILDGMKSSCAVVFFITPSFKDDGYLETEVNYAIQEKRSKKDKFAIVTLLIEGEDGSVGTIPDLLKPYIWCQPSSQLESLREVVRALPVATTGVDWREGIRDVARAVNVPTASTDLSEEAKEILLAAADNGGFIQHVDSFRSTQISTGSVSFLPDQEERTIAIWVGGLEDLQRRRYIKSQGPKGHLFKVTREGYAAADVLKAARSQA